MNKEKLIEILKEFPDDMEVRMTNKSDTYSYTIEKAYKDEINDFISFEIGEFVSNKKRDVWADDYGRIDLSNEKAPIL